MMKSKKAAKVKSDTSAEQRIINAARKVFHEKGYDATRTRDIAEEAGINLALLNYYFRSKEKLFDIIVFETMEKFFQSLKEVFNDEKTSIEQKVEALVEKYVDLLSRHPEIPLFILSEVRKRPAELVQRIGMKELVMQSFFLRQYMEEANSGKIKMLHPLHFIMNILGLTVFPFIASPILRSIGNLSPADWNDLMQERKKMVPVWIKSILNPESL